MVPPLVLRTASGLRKVTTQKESLTHCRTSALCPSVRLPVCPWGVPMGTLQGSGVPGSRHRVWLKVCPWGGGVSSHLLCGQVTLTTWFVAGGLGAGRGACGGRGARGERGARGAGQVATGADPG